MGKNYNFYIMFCIMHGLTPSTADTEQYVALSASLTSMLMLRLAVHQYAHSRLLAGQKQR